jgi:phosphate starvation-inducible PhoH-like protein
VDKTLNITSNTTIKGDNVARIKSSKVSPARQKFERENLIDFYPEVAPNNRKTFTLKDLKSIRPLTENQAVAFDAWSAGKHLFLGGSAGTGKSFQALYFALKTILDPNAPQKRIVLIRSAVESRSQGFLPGDLEEKMAVYQLPYMSLCDNLFTFKKSYTNMKALGLIEFHTTSYLRGCEFDDAVIILEEVQNFIDHEIDTCMSRVGEGSRVIVTGDIKQNDLARKHEKTGFDMIDHVVQHMKSFEAIHFTPEDSVRSAFVKEYLKLRESM